ncbi:hypothetical protein V6N13_041304 [Hibiscus sabdariffa]
MSAVHRQRDLTGEHFSKSITPFQCSTSLENTKKKNKSPHNKFKTNKELPSKLGRAKLENQYAAETARLNPQHKFVPWVLVNDQPLQEDFKNFVTYVCNAYKGKQVPQACHSLPLMNNSSKKATSGYPALLLSADTPYSITLLLIYEIYFCFSLL